MSYFTTEIKYSDLLFQGLNIESAGGMVAACFVTFFVTVLFEGMKTLKMYLDLRLGENPFVHVQNRHSQDPNTEPDMSGIASDHNILLASLQFPATVQQIRKQKLLFHALSTVSMMMNLIVGYILMLVVMTFDAWLTIAVVAGSGLGYFVFNAYGQVIQLRLKPQPSSAFGAGADCLEVPPPPRSSRTTQACCGDL